MNESNGNQKEFRDRIYEDLRDIKLNMTTIHGRIDTIDKSLNENWTESKVTEARVDALVAAKGNSRARTVAIWIAVLSGVSAPVGAVILYAMGFVAIQTP